MPRTIGACWPDWSPFTARIKRPIPKPWLLALIYIEGLSYQEVADRLERPIGSIGPLRGRALKRMARAVAELERPPQEMVA